MNRYRHCFSARCVNNGQRVDYELEIETDGAVIMVEDIAAACREIAETTDKPYHETMADELARRFGGRQIMRAHHHGTDIETRRGF